MPEDPLPAGEFARYHKPFIFRKCSSDNDYIGPRRTCICWRSICAKRGDGQVIDDFEM